VCSQDRYRSILQLSNSVGEPVSRETETQTFKAKPKRLLECSRDLEVLLWWRIGSRSVVVGWAPLRCILRKEKEASNQAPIFVRTMKEFLPFRLDLPNQCLWRSREREEEQRILLSPKAFAMLRYVVERAGRLVTQDELLEALWSEAFVQPEVLKSHIRDIRGALGDDPKTPHFIETLPRRGYRFIAPVNESSEEVAFEVTPQPAI
jgi:DNA-binding winged helix-turn-helix (wHTH) protein